MVRLLGLSKLLEHHTMIGYKWTAAGKEEAKQDWLKQFTGTLRCGVADLADSHFCGAFGLLIIEAEKLSDALIEAGIQQADSSLDEAIALLTEEQQRLIERLLMPDDFTTQWERRFGD